MLLPRLSLSHSTMCEHLGVYLPQRRCQFAHPGADQLAGREARIR